jgi:hypothetical protein
MPPEDSYITNDMISQWAARSIHDSPEITKEKLMEILKSAPVKYGEQVRTKSAPPPPNVTSKTYNDYYNMENEKRIAVLERHLKEVRESLVDAIQLATQRDLQYQQQMTSLEKVIVAMATQNKELSKRITDLEWEGITP